MSLPEFNIISVIDEILGRSGHGAMHRFTFDSASGFTGMKVERMLRTYGIRVWGRQVQGSKRSFLVKRSQAVWAEYLLCRMGVPLESKILDQRNLQYPQYHEKPMPTPWSSQGIGPISFVDKLGEFMARLVG